ncbi:hypothetical protein HIM_03519 [Hirsutella minnesotensis 3608]|uniref:Uncharacterized protein n=1 Tax=Hirsutella minnesotensis 3608 TaxID=1043627 RepID=A0A0F7ZVU0_9HYPO|nr:hypothetical protein HIM_03519 [Hirsutella minnesotensis 3608]
MADKKIVLVTGANTGLGFQIVKALHGSGETYEILLGGRSLEKAKAAVEIAISEHKTSKSTLVPIQIEIEKDESIDAAFEHVKAKYGRLDVLVNNAGAQFDPEYTSGSMSMREVWNRSWSVNTVGTQVTTSKFVPLLLLSSDARLLFITSGASSLTTSENLELPINRVPPKGWPKSGPPQSNVPAYRSAKTGMNMMMREWCRNLKEDGVKVWCVSPGYLATGLGGDQELNKAQGAIDPAIGGRFVKDVIEGCRDGDVGKVILKDKVQPW